MRVCQFRHDGKWTSAAAGGNAAASGRPASLFYSPCVECQSRAAFRGDSQRLTTIAKRNTFLIHDAAQHDQVNTNNAGATQAKMGAAPACCETEMRKTRVGNQTYSSFAFIEILAFKTFETGHPFSAASAYFWKVAASAPGTLPTTSM